MERLSRGARAFARAETLIATIWFTVAAKRAALLALAALVAALGVAMLDAAGYLALEPRVGPAWAALCVAGGDFAIAAILAFAASRVRPGRDLDLALELRSQAVEQFGGLAANPIHLVGRALIGPLAGLLLQLLRSAIKRSSKAKDDAV